jgi:PRC-barrel domain
MSAGPPGQRRPAARLIALAIVLAACRLGGAYADNATPPPAAPAPSSGGQPPKAAGESKPATQVTPSQRTLEPIAHEVAAGILGTKAEGPDGEDMGLVVDVVVDRNSRPTAVVIDFGGFLGVGSRKIAIDWRLVRVKPGAKSPVRVKISRGDLEGAPEFDATAPSNQMVGPVIIERPEAPDAGN